MSWDDLGRFGKVAVVVLFVVFIIAPAAITFFKAVTQ